MYCQGVLVADDLQDGEPLCVPLSRLAGGPLHLQIVPFTPAREVYLEDPALQSAGLTAGISRITAVPIYEAVLQPRQSN